MTGAYRVFVFFGGKIPRNPITWTLEPMVTNTTWITWDRLRKHAAELTEALKAFLVEGIEKEMEGQDQETLVARRDAALVEMFKLKRKYGF